MFVLVALCVSVCNIYVCMHVYAHQLLLDHLFFMESLFLLDPVEVLAEVRRLKTAFGRGGKV